ncbi:MAG: hypothetical protein LBH28_08565, partial [Oscillospiraceae bacterium]|nr:hypothetical protein [Oscillospiraceae bacterium]
FPPCEAEDAALLTQGKDDNEAGRKKDKQETANLSDREYNSAAGGNACGFLINGPNMSCLTALMARNWSGGGGLCL